MVTKKRDNKRPKSRGKNITRRPERVGYCPEEGFDYKAVGLLKKYISDWQNRFCKKKWLIFKMPKKFNSCC